MYSFFLLANVSAHERLVLVGGAVQMGGWALQRAVAMTPLGGGNWTASIHLEGYRYVERLGAGCLAFSGEV